MFQARGISPPRCLCVLPASISSCRLPSNIDDNDNDDDDDDDGCGGRKIGWPALHNEARDAVGVLASPKTCYEVVHESFSTDSPDKTLIANLLQVRSVWVDVLFDVHVVDTNAPSY